MQCTHNSFTITFIKTIHQTNTNTQTPLSPPHQPNSTHPIIVYKITHRRKPHPRTKRAAENRPGKKTNHESKRKNEFRREGAAAIREQSGQPSCIVVGSGHATSRAKTRAAAIESKVHLYIHTYNAITERREVCTVVYLETSLLSLLPPGWRREETTEAEPAGMILMRFSRHQEHSRRASSAAFDDREQLAAHGDWR